MDEKGKKKAKKVMKWLWNLALIYVLIFMFYVWWDAKQNPKLYVLVEERIDAGTGVVFNDDGSTRIPEDWEKESSTINECKPMLHLLDLYNRWLKPLVYFVFLMALARLIIDNWDRLKKYSEKEDEEESKEQKNGDGELS